MWVIFILLVVVPCLSHAAIAAVIPFSLDGALDSATADSSTYNTGGKITVNGLSIVIPKNLQLQLPASWVPFKDIAAGGFTGNEVSVVGNYVDGVAIAGIVQLSQFFLEANSGVINSLSLDGAITMVGGQVIRINDPNGVYSAGYTQRPAFTADDQNPSITAFSGFPMCVPRSSFDAKCPASNRPAGRTSFTAPDPLTMAPFLPGDYLEFAGIRVGSEIICYSIVAPSVQILTTGVPAYIRVEEAIIGILDTQNPANVEFADSRFVGYTSDASASVAITRSEIDPCTGKINDVSVGSAAPTGVRNKWIWRASSSALTKYAREYKATASSGTKSTNGGQITAGQYIAPVSEWIFPELSLPGAQPGKNDFSQFTNLRDGLGPDADGNVWGQLSPWPDTTAPAPSKTCDATSPAPPTPTDMTTPGTSSLVADAGPDVATRPGVSALLVGKAENASSFSVGDLSYSWSQSSGPTVIMTGAAAATASFTAPSVSALTNYTFVLTVKSSSLGTNSTDTLVVSNDPKAIDTVVVDSYTWTTQQGGTIAVNAHGNVIDGSAKLSLILNNPNAGTPLAMTSAGGGKFIYNARSTKQPSNGITVSSNLGGKASKTATTTKKKREHSRSFSLG